MNVNISNELNFSVVHEGMNLRRVARKVYFARDPLQLLPSRFRAHVNFASDPLRLIPSRFRAHVNFASDPLRFILS